MTHPDARTQSRASTTKGAGMKYLEWMTRCAAQYETKGGLHPEEAREAAIAAFEEDKDGVFADDPEGAADEDMSYWTDDGEG